MNSWLTVMRIMASDQALYSVYFEWRKILTATERLSFLYSRFASPYACHTRVTFHDYLPNVVLACELYNMVCKISFPTGRGTSMLDGLSIAWAVIEYLHSKINCRTLASTHYYQLAKLADSLPRVDCYHVTAKNSEEGISFTFKVLVSISVLLHFSVSRDRDHFGHMT